MFLLSLGVLLFCLAHLVPSALPEVRAKAVEKLGLMPYKGAFALVSIVAVVLIVVGWQAVEPVTVYQLPPPAGGAAKALMIVALVLFVAPYFPTNIRRGVRYQQLTAALVWGSAHLIANGDNRSLVLFGGLAMWSVVAMALKSRRDGEWQVPEPFSPVGDAMVVVAGVAAYVVLVFLHPVIFGGPDLIGEFLM